MFNSNLIFNGLTNVGKFKFYLKKTRYFKNHINAVKIHSTF